MLIEMTDQNIMELIGNIYKIKETKGHTLIKDFYFPS